MEPFFETALALEQRECLTNEIESADIDAVVDWLRWIAVDPLPAMKDGFHRRVVRRQGPRLLAVRVADVAAPFVFEKDRVVVLQYLANGLPADKYQHLFRLPFEESRRRMVCINRQKSVPALRVN